MEKEGGRESRAGTGGIRHVMAPHVTYSPTHPTPIAYPSTSKISLHLFVGYAHMTVAQCPTQSDYVLAKWGMVF
jgi:hypothetical protein